MQTQPNPQEPATAPVIEIDLPQSDQVGGGKFTAYVINSNTYFRDSWSGRIGVEDSASGTSHWL